MIRVGIGGWTFAPWRDNFYPKGLPYAKELAYAGTHVTSIEINGTFYRAQSPASFAKWREETPPGFVFSIKGHRGVVAQAKLNETAEQLAWFLDSGMLELGDKLGPFLWQMPHTKKFNADEIAGFFALLPQEAGGRPLRHAFEPRHETFATPEFVDLARAANVAIVYADNPKYPEIADLSGGFVYARLQNAAAEEPAGYSAAALDAWATRAQGWMDGLAAPDLPLLAAPGEGGRRDVFVYMINGAKERAPHAAMAMIERVGRP
ncbi:MAG: DUF72 domain-containing protein [Bauldia sp.]|nr:DUF72 domain-containing protein [Bauldia sp.]